MNARHIRRGGTALVAALSALVLSLGLAAPAAAEEGLQKIVPNKTYQISPENIGNWTFELDKPGAIQLEVTLRAPAGTDSESSMSFDVSTHFDQVPDDLYDMFNQRFTASLGDGTSTSVMTGVDAGAYDISASGDLGSNWDGDFTLRYTPSDDWETEPNGKISRCDTLELGKAKKGSISAAFDTDWYKFTVPGFGTMEFTLEGTGPAGTYELYVMDSDNPYADEGAFLELYEIPSGSKVQTGAIELAPGTHYVTVSSIGNSAVDCTYSLTATFTADAEIPMWRLYNPYSGEHLFTRDAEEREKLASIGWTDEGLAWTAPGTGEVVWRLYNPYSGDHHYTMKADEYESLAEIGWEQEGIAWYSASKDDKGAVPLYRLFNPYATVATHHYTASSDEYNKLGEVGWEQEGYAWYGVTLAKK